MNPIKLLRALLTAAPRIPAAEGLRRVAAGVAIVIDVREPREWADGVVERAVLLPLSDLTGRRVHWTRFLEENADRELLLYCGAGVRSGMAARILAREGYRVANAGSLREWSAAGSRIAPPSTSPTS